MRSLPSPWDQRALAYIEEHLAVEAKASDACEAFSKAEGSGSDAPRWAHRGGRQRHHQVLARIAAVLRAEVSDVAVPVPHVEVSAEQRKELLDETYRLLDMEKADATALKELRYALRSAPEETL